MTSEDRVNTSQKGQSISKWKIELYVIGCGQGDTLLARLGGVHWILIDCHLPKGGIRERFFKLVEKLEIRRLAGIFLTHMDQDHFLGMKEVVEYFTAEDRTIGLYSDTAPVGPKEFLNLLEDAEHPFYQPYLDLQETISDRLETRTIEQYLIVNRDQGSLPINPSNGAQIVPVAPDPLDLRRVSRATLTRRRLAESLNAISIVLVFQATDGTKTISMLLAGDATSDALSRSLAYWQKHKGNLRGDCSFVAVKVPHHGSIDSHAASLCDMRDKGNPAIAAISVGTAYRAHPDRRVLQDYLNKKWIVASTRKRSPANRRKDQPFTLSGRTKEAAGFGEVQDIIIRWSGDGGLHWEPLSSQIVVADLLNYEEALSKNKT